MLHKTKKKIYQSMTIKEVKNNLMFLIIYVSIMF